MKKARLPDERMKRRLRDIGLKIAYYRKRHNLTQDVLAERVDYTATYVSRVESFRENDLVVPTLDFLYRVADELGVPVTKFLEEEEK